MQRFGRRIATALAVLAISCLTVTPRVLSGDDEDVVFFLRGDTDGNGSIDISDGIRALGCFFLFDCLQPCDAAVDVDDSGSKNVTDGIYIFNFLFLGGAPPAGGVFPNCEPLEPGE
ncbi:MAG: hypothetical protein AAF517_27525, partial [Planctomycetota bacterium]